LERILQMRFLEDLPNGDCFRIDDNFFIVTSDFKLGKHTQSRSCVSLKDGSFRWVDSNTMVEEFPIFSLDKESNIIPIKEKKKDEGVSK
jgi:hypothetical protein